MAEAAIQTEQASKADLCTRCLQPVAFRAARCPGCGQPHHSRRYVPLLIGVAGIAALAFVMALMYYVAWRADVINADIPVDDAGAKHEIMVDTAAPNGTSAQPEKPEKKPPLNEK